MTQLDHMTYSFKTGDRVIYRGGWGNNPGQVGTIVDNGGTHKGRMAWGVDLDNGNPPGGSHWGYADQFTLIQEG